MHLYSAVKEYVYFWLDGKHLPTLKNLSKLLVKSHLYFKVPKYVNDAKATSKIFQPHRGGLQLTFSQWHWSEVKSNYIL